MTPRTGDKAVTARGRAAALDLEQARQIASKELGLDRDGGRPLSDGTHEYYSDCAIRVMRRLEELGKPVRYTELVKIAKADGVQTKTLEYWRVAIRYLLACSILELDGKAEESYRAGDHHESDRLTGHALEAARAIQDLARRRTGENRQRTGSRKVQGDRARASLAAAAEHAAGRGYADWRRDLINHSPDYLALAMHVQAVCGCRPVEVPRVAVRALADGRLAFRIRSAKTDRAGRRGQPRRAFLLGGIDPLAIDLWRHVRRTGGTLRDVPISRRSRNPPNAYSRAVRDLAVDLGYKGISANAFRHQFGSDIKRGGVYYTDIAKALGHRSGKTQQVYGRAAAGRGGLIDLESAKAPRSIKAPESAASIEARINGEDDDDDRAAPEPE